MAAKKRQYNTSLFGNQDYAMIDGTWQMRIYTTYFGFDFWSFLRSECSSDMYVTTW